MRADWVAANIYGANTMGAALKIVHSVSNHYNEAAYNVAANSTDSFFDNYQKLVYSDSKKLSEYESLEMMREENDFDTHPTIAVRIGNLPTKDNIKGEDNIKDIFEEIKDDIKRLSSTFTQRVKAVKDYYDKVAKLAEQSKQAESRVVTTADSLVCPKCGKGYDDSWKVCLGCSAELVKNPNHKSNK